VPPAATATQVAHASNDATAVPTPTPAPSTSLEALAPPDSPPPKAVLTSTGPPAQSPNAAALGPWLAFGSTAILLLTLGAVNLRRRGP
jgi:hypothetical protein